MLWGKSASGGMGGSGNSSIEERGCLIQASSFFVKFSIRFAELLLQYSSLL